MPVLISVPHAGTRVPQEVRDHCILTERQIVEDGDEGAAAIYDIQPEVAAYVTTDVARAIVDLNRAEDNRRPDGVVKTQTCLDVPVYDPFPDETTVERLLERYYRPYHARLRDLASLVRVGVDCHTMLAIGPPMGPLAGVERPRICLSNVDGATCSDGWLRTMADCLSEAFDFEIACNHPFKGGHIVREHAKELPWMQLELSRASFLDDAGKRRCVLTALERFCRIVF